MATDSDRTRGATPTLAPPAPGRYVICGVNQLTARVSEELLDQGSDITLVLDAGMDPTDPHVADLIDDRIHLVRPHTQRGQTLRAAGLAGADCLLLIDDDDYENIKYSVAGSQVDPEVPVVLRAFNATLAERLEEGYNVRRAFSVSALSAPVFVAAALGEEVLQTLRLGDEEIPLCRLTVEPDTPIVGLTPEEVKASTECGVIALATPNGTWSPATTQSRPLAPGDSILVGGLLLDVLRLARDNAPPAPSHATETSRPQTIRQGLGQRILPAILLTYLVLVGVTAYIYSQEFGFDALKAIHTALNVSLGDPGPGDINNWITAVNISSTILGVILGAVLISYIAAVVIEERLDERMERQAGRSVDHFVVAGLGRIGFRVLRILEELDLDAVVIHDTPDNPFAQAATGIAPVLTGDVSLEENVLRTSAADARAIIATSDDDLANLSACLHARHHNPTIRTVARVFDDDLSSNIGPTFGIDVVASVSAYAASSFVGAATDEQAVRRLQVGALEIAAFRFDAINTVTTATLDAWRRRGARILAHADRHGAVHPPTASVANGLQIGESAVIAGPVPVIAELISAAGSSGRV